MRELSNDPKPKVNPIGINLTTFESEEDKRLVDWNNPVEVERRKSKIANIGSFDPIIPEIEEKPILAIRIGIQEPEHQFGIPCPECKAVNVIVGDGCAHCEPVLDVQPDKSVGVKKKRSLIDEIEIIGVTTKKNRARTKTDPRIGKGGYAKTTSPHLTGNGWKPAAAPMQKRFLGSNEAHWDNSDLQKKIENTGFQKIRKNTIAKVSKLEKRKQARKGVAKIKGKL